jgi:hypothetical protein
VRASAESIGRLLDRDLHALQQEMAAYPDDDALWVLPPGVANSGGTLALHLVGNLRHFIGAVLGGGSYVRDREQEFSQRGLSRHAVIAMIADTRRDVMSVLSALNPARLSQPFPIAVLDTQLVTSDFLLHLCTHLTYHVGQVDYHRRITTGQGRTVKTISIPALVAPWPSETAS